MKDIEQTALRKLPFYRHNLGQEEVNAVAEVIAGVILTTGETVELFEQRFADFLDCKYALAVTSCTGALHMSLLALDIGKGDEVITTPMSFIATSTAILESGATPVFVDVDLATGNIDPTRIEAAITPKTRAIMPVHLYGLMADMKAIRKIADHHGLAVIEDSAHCVEGQLDGQKPGSLGTTACFSFYATKNLACGEGGALVTNDEDLYQKLKLLRLHGMNKSAYDRHKKGYHHWDMVLMGWKYNMSNIEAALLLPQLERLPATHANRLLLAQRYHELLSGVPEVRLPDFGPASSTHAHHIFPVWLEGVDRDLVLKKLVEKNCEVTINYRPIHLNSWFMETFGFQPGQFPITERLGDSTLSLPFFPSMPLDDVDEVVARLTDSIAEAG